VVSCEKTDVLINKMAVKIEQVLGIEIIIYLKKQNHPGSEGIGLPTIRISRNA
jgi:hypothetical protein